MKPTLEIIMINMHVCKYACMCGMIYLAKEWQLGGYSRLKELFDQGYHGFARKCI